MFFFVIEAFGTNAQPASSGCSTQRVWDYPNKHFATQKWHLYITIIQVISVQLGFPQVLIFSFNGILVSILLIVAEKIKQKHGGFLYEAVE